MNNICYYTLLPFSDKIKVSEAGYSLAEKTAKKYLGENADLTLAYNKNGKPYFKSYPDFHFNISHSKNILAVAFSNQPVGIDVEKHREIKLKLSERYFSSEEKEFAKSSDSFFYIWTRKEAFAKQRGESVALYLSSFNSLKCEQIQTYQVEKFTLSICSETNQKFEILEI